MWEYLEQYHASVFGDGEYPSPKPYKFARRESPKVG